MSDVSIIGGITADIEGNPYKQLIQGDSNPGKISMFYGGVGRNITENLARMGTSVNFISAAGDDFAGRGAVRELSDIGVDVENIRLMPEENTAVYMSILNLMGDMELALCNMDILERISTDFIDDAYESIKNSEIIGVDTNLTEETLDYTTKKLKDIPLFLDPVSVTKAERARKIVGRFHTIKPNRMEAEVLSGLNILNGEELEEAGRWFLGQGVRRVFITLGPGGVFFCDEKDSGIIRPEPTEIVSATGAGDAFSAAIIYSHLKGFDLKRTAETGMAAALITMGSKSAVNRRMSEELLLRELKQ